MALSVSPISFGNNRFVISNPDSDSTVKETYDGKVRTKRVVMDSHQRIVDSVNFDNLGRKVSHLHKFYTDNGYIETYKDFNQEYSREVKTTIVNAQKIITENFRSITSPSKSYIAKFVRNLEDKLVMIVINDKVIKI